MINLAFTVPSFLQLHNFVFNFFLFQCQTIVRQPQKCTTKQRFSWSLRIPWEVIAWASRRQCHGFIDATALSDGYRRVLPSRLKITHTFTYCTELVVGVTEKSRGGEFLSFDLTLTNIHTYTYHMHIRI